MDIKNSIIYLKGFALWLCLGVMVGIPGGILGSVFHICVDKATELRTLAPQLLFLLPIGGAVIALMYDVFAKNKDIGTDRILVSAEGNDSVPFVTVPLIFISSVISHFLGASVGREGAALQLGGGLGYNLSKCLKIRKENVPVVVMSGMSAVFAALFGTPVTAAFFAIEVSCVGFMHYGALLPCTVSALCGVKIAEMFGIAPVKFIVPSYKSTDLSILWRVALLAVLCALVSILFVTAIQKTSAWAEKLCKNSIIRAAVGGFVIIALTVALNTREYNGAGMETIARAMEGDAAPQAFLIKLIFTAISVAVGFKGGEIVPAFFVGSTFGCFAGGFLGLDSGFAAAIGFVSVFCGAVNCPATALILSIEVFGGSSPLLFAVSVAISYVLSGKYSLYKVQKMPNTKMQDLFNIEKNSRNP